jgi:kynurenine formamidase
MIDSVLQALGKAQWFDLAHTYRIGIPHHPVHPPFQFSMIKQHGEFMRGDASSAAEAFAMGGHVGTHIDALCHFSKAGKLCGGVDAADAQSYSSGVAHLSIDTVGPIFRRGVLLDAAAAEQRKVLPPDHAIDAACIERICSKQNISIREGDIVLFRTGWATYWDSPKDYIAEVKGPGVNESGARWLSARKIFAAGSDTIAFELVPSEMPVHVHFLVESGIHIIEALNLEELAAQRIYEFLFAAIPLKIGGGTGSPIRPVALVPAA